MKNCSRCKENKELSEFQKDSSRKDGLSYHCNYCRSDISHNTYKNRNPTCERKGQSTGTFDRHEHTRQYRKNDLARNAAYSAKRRSQKLLAKPNWYEHEEIMEIYRKCKQISEKTGITHNVDHIVPLLNENVCGLHCVDNLQILTEEENRRKNNTFN